AVFPCAGSAENAGFEAQRIGELVAGETAGRALRPVFGRSYIEHVAMQKAQSLSACESGRVMAHLLLQALRRCRRRDRERSGVSARKRRTALPHVNSPCSAAQPEALWIGRLNVVHQLDVAAFD